MFIFKFIQPKVHIIYLIKIIYYSFLIYFLVFMMNIGIMKAIINFIAKGSCSLLFIYFNNWKLKIFMSETINY